MVVLTLLHYYTVYIKVVKKVLGWGNEDIEQEVAKRVSVRNGETLRGGGGGLSYVS